MTDEMFINAILATPADDAPRLVYADWLEEQGRVDKAELIRVQIAIAVEEQKRTDRFNDDTNWQDCKDCAGIPSNWCPNCGDCVCPHDGEGNYESKDDPACPLHNEQSLHCCLWYIAHKLSHLYEREKELLKTYQAAELPIQCPVAIYYGNLNPDVQNEGIEFTWRRGFVESVKTSWDNWQEFAAAILANAPVAAVTLTTMPMPCYGPVQDGEKDTRRCWFSTRPDVTVMVDFLAEPIVANVRIVRSLLVGHWPRINWILPNGPVVNSLYNGTNVMMTASGVSIPISSLSLPVQPEEPESHPAARNPAPRNRGPDQYRPRYGRGR